MTFLIIQTAFIGDVILATAVVEKLSQKFPDVKIDFLLRKGNESLLENNPHISEVIVWDKKQNKISNLFGIVKKVRSKKYTHVINLHRFASSGIITGLSSAQHKIGFDKNPFSFLFTQKFEHNTNGRQHETLRNQNLISNLTDSIPAKPKLYPSDADIKAVARFKNEKYSCIAPASVWFTKQFPKEKWVEVLNSFNSGSNVYLLGAASDNSACEWIIENTSNKKITNLAGKLTFLESAALMKDAVMNYTNDSAPLHIASAMNAPVRVVFCSTVPEFGFGPLSDDSKIIQTKEKLDCRPCGLHGFAVCPKGHFECALLIDIKEFAL